MSGAVVAIVIGVAVALGYLALPGQDRGTPTLPPGIATATSGESASPSAVASGPYPKPSLSPSPSPPTMVFDADGIPVAIDGRPVLRGDAIRQRARSGDTAAFLVAGYVMRYATHCPNGNYDCSHVRLEDARWPTVDEATPIIQLLPYQASDWSTWEPGPFSVLQVRSGCLADNALQQGAICLTVEVGIADPRPDPPTPSLKPAARYDPGGIPVAFAGRPVLHGPEIGQVLAQVGRESFLVTGSLGFAMYDCVVGYCPTGSVMTLDPPGLPTAPDRGPTFALFDNNGTWRPPYDQKWPGDLVVLRVRAYDGTCPWHDFCKGGLLVEATVDPQ